MHCILSVVPPGLYLCIGDPFLPGKQGSAWAILICWVGGHIGAFLAELVGNLDQWSGSPCRCQQIHLPPRVSFHTRCMTTLNVYATAQQTSVQ